MNIVYYNNMKKSFRKLLLNGFDARILEVALEWIKANKTPPIDRYKDHPLSGNLKGWWDLHLKSDLILVYRVEGDDIYLLDIGTHNQVFGK